LIVFHLAQFDQFNTVGNGLFQTSDRADTAFKVLAFAHDTLGFFRIVPKIRILSLGIQQVEITQRLIPVKDASSAAQWTA
jgi:hypothetical protein